MPIWLKALATLAPILLGALVSIAWSNSHALSVLAINIEHLRVDLERTRASLEPGRTIMLRLDTNEKQLDHLRELVEARLVCPQQVPR
jgi:urease accessory protein UreE